MDKKIIPIDMFSTCLLDGKTRREIIKLYPLRTDGAYYMNKFANHLNKVHNISLKDYCINYLNVEWPKCPIKNIDVFYDMNGKGMILSKFSHHAGVGQEHSEKFKSFVERLKIERLGPGNPMYKKRPWNLNKPFSAEARKKMSASAVKRRQREGELGRTSIELKMAEFLTEINVDYVSQAAIGNYSVDFFIDSYNLIIETDGDFWHCNPQFYPNGPTSQLQVRAFFLDKIRQDELESKGYKVLRFWECDINSGVFEKRLLEELEKIEKENEIIKD